MVKVSVIIPCYNGAHFLPDALESALAQSWTDYELLIVDDGSTDSTAQVAQEYGRRDPGRIRYIHQENQGLAVARNTAIAHAHGEYLALLDCDDIWMPDRLAAGVAFLDAHPDVGLVHANVVRMDVNKKPLRIPDRQEQYLSGAIFEFIYTRLAHLACPTILFRRACIDRVGNFDPFLSRLGCEDRDLWLRIAHEYPIAYIPRELAYYRQSDTSMSRNLNKMMKARIYVNQKYAEKGWVGWRLKREGLAGIYQDLAYMHAQGGDHWKARYRLLQALFLCPYRRSVLTSFVRGMIGFK